MATSGENLRGAGWMTLAMAGYVTNDAAIKFAAEDLPLFQAIFVRGVFIVALLTVLNVRRGQLGRLVERPERPMLLRFAMETVGTIVYLLALTRLPLAGLTAVLQIVPIAVTFAAARLLREPVSAARVGAVVVGFAGVLCILRPWSDAFSPWYLAGVLAVAIVVVRELATRRISNTVPALVIALGTAISITVMAAVLSVIEGWDQLGMRSIGVLAIASVFLTVGYVASVTTVRTGDLSFSAPFRYSVMVFAIALQIVVFGEVPDVWTFIGSAVIAAAGLWAFAREREIPTRAVAR